MAVMIVFLVVLCSTLCSSSAAALDAENRETETDMEAVLDRLVSHKMEAMKQVLLERLEDRHSREIQALETRFHKLQNEMEQQRTEQERQTSVLMQRIEWLERRVKEAEDPRDDRAEGAVTMDDETTADDDFRLHWSLMTTKLSWGQDMKWKSSQSQQRKQHSPRKRSDDYGPLQPVVSHLSQQLNEMTAEVQALKNANVLNELGRGSDYVRWGNAGCPNASHAETVYSGFVGGSFYSSTGAAANALCLPSDPVFDNHPIPSSGATELFGSEYETCLEPECDETPLCAVCRVARATTIMVPGKNNCWSGWTLEYSGYLMAGYPTLAAATEFICVDSSVSGLHGSKNNDNGKLFYYTIFRCGSLPCPPYVEGKIVQCVVCSR